MLFVGTEADARLRLERMVDASSVPTLGSPDIDQLLADSKWPDLSGLGPTESGWTPTWELDLAAFRGWGLKEGKAANMNQYLQDGRGTASDYLVLNCRRMKEYHRTLITPSLRYQGGMATVSTYW